MADGKKAKLQIYRGDREGGRLQEYEVETYTGMVVLDADGGAA